MAYEKGLGEDVVIQWVRVSQQAGFYVLKTYSSHFCFFLPHIVPMCRLHRELASLCLICFAAGSKQPLLWFYQINFERK